MEKAIAFADAYGSLKQPVDVNEAIELFNVYRLLGHPALKEEIRNKYKTVIKEYMPYVAKYFKSICNDNFVTECEEVDGSYIDDFWLLFEKFSVYEKVEDNRFAEYVNKSTTVLYHILKHEKIVNHYGVILADCLRKSKQTARIILHVYMEKSSERWYVPSQLRPEEYEGLLQEYIDSGNPGIGELEVISVYQSTKQCPISDRLRLAAQKKKKEKFNDGSIITNTVEYGAKISFQDINTVVRIEQEGIMTWSYIYDIKWIDQNKDYPTLWNNFIYLFEFVDLEFRSTFPACSSELGVFERSMGVKAIKEYSVGGVFYLNDMRSSAQMEAYYEELKRKSIRLEELLEWFFREYLRDEFNVEGFVFNAPSRTSSVLEKCRNLPAELDGILKQFSMYVEDGAIDRELFEMSSNPVDISKVESMIKNKYAYVKSSELEREMEYLFSDQNLMAYVERIDGNYKNLYELLSNNAIYMSDYVRKEQINTLEWLRSRNAIQIDNGLITVNKFRCIVLKDFFEKEVICPIYYPNLLKKIVDDLAERNEIVFENTLFSKPEADYLNYMLNKSEFSNGKDLRNRYIHSSYPVNEAQQKRDYISLFKIAVLYVIKINEEFCNRNK